MTKLTLAPVGSLIDATTAQTTINNNDAAIVTAVENTLSRDGTSPNQMGASIDMNSNRILNLTQPATADEPLRLQDLSSFIGGGTVTNIPAGGTTGQVLAKTSNTDYAVNWTSESAELVAGTNIALTGTTPTTISTVASPTFTTTTSTNVNVPSLTVSQSVQTDGSKNLVSLANTGSGSNVLANTPTLITPVLGAATGTSLNLSSLTASNAVTTDGSKNLVSTAITGTGSIVAATSPALVTPVLGTPTSGTLTNCTGFPTASLAGLGANVATFLATPTTANFAAAVTGETGTGAVVFGTSPSLTTPSFSSIVNTGTLTLPTSTDTLIGKATTDTLTNKTFDTAATGNTLQIGSTVVSRGQYPAISSNTAATAGNIGDYVEGVVANGSAISVTASGTPQNLTSISLPAGEWLVSGSVNFITAATTAITTLQCSFSTTSASLDFTSGRLAARQSASFVPGSSIANTIELPSYKFSLSGTTTIFFVMLANFTVSTLTAAGIIKAWRYH